MTHGGPAGEHRVAGRAAWPLTGREPELAAVAAARADPACTGVVIVAAAGVGKSRLAQEAEEAAAHDGAALRTARATSSAAAVPLGAFAGLIPPDVRSDDPLELMRRSADAIAGAAERGRVVLGVDDAQLLDPVSAALVLHLAESARVFVIATVRAGEHCPDAIVSLWKDAGARRMDLRRLDDATVAQLVETALGAPVEQARCAGWWSPRRQRALRARARPRRRRRRARSRSTAGSGGWRDGRRSARR